MKYEWIPRGSAIASVLQSFGIRIQLEASERNTAAKSVDPVGPIWNTDSRKTEKIAGYSAV